MSRVKSVGVANLRTLRAVPPVPLAPITVLLGKNSVGKSTFARIFPLLRQSVEAKKRAPILWYGSAVDFGSLAQAVSHGQDELTFTFDIEVDDDNRRGIINSAYSGRSMALGACRLSVILTQDSDGGAAYAKEVTIDVVGSTLQLKFTKPTSSGIGEVQIVVDGTLQKVPQNTRIYASQGTFLPRITFLQTTQDDLKYEVRPNPWQNLPVSILRRIIHGNAAQDTVERIAGRLVLTSPRRLATLMKSISGPASWRSFVNDEGRAALYSSEISRSLVIGSCERIVEKMDAIISSFFQGVRYLKPLRATAERYYRQVDLAVSEVDPDGGNFAMFLSSMRGTPELASFQSFVSQFLGIRINVLKEGEQVSVMAMSDDETKEFNIADMGFGISQVLPLAAQLWLSLKPRRAQAASTVVVLEQPELHLHPDLQSRLGDLFASFCRSNSSEPDSGKCLVIETHSEALVERLGQLVEKQVLQAKDVQILLFEPSSRPNDTLIRVANFDNKGVLENWPYGFFDPEIR